MHPKPVPFQLQRIDRERDRKEGPIWCGVHFSDAGPDKQDTCANEVIFCQNSAGNNFQLATNPYVTLPMETAT